MSRQPTVVLAAALFLSASSSAGAQCQAAGDLVRLPMLKEASGVAASRRSPGTLWALNDSGEPVIYALDANGAVAGRIRLTGATLDDWEAIAVGPCAAGTCLYVGDIGDNNGTRKQITIYRLAEPAATGDSTAAVEALHARYPDGPQDAESLFITPDGTLYIVTKGEKGSVAVYRVPRDPKPGSSIALERVGKPREDAKSRASERITDAAASPQGDWIVLRTNRALEFHRTKELLSGNWQSAHVVDLASLKEPQGEGVTFAGEDSIVIAGEGGAKSAAGTLARLSCSLLR